MRSLRTSNLTSASAPEEWNGDLWWWSRPEQYADIAGGEHVGKFGHARDYDTGLARPVRSHALCPCCQTQNWETQYQSEPDHTSVSLRRTRVARLVWRSTCFQIAQVLRCRGWLTGLTGDGANDFAHAPEGNVGIAVD